MIKEYFVEGKNVNEAYEKALSQYSHLGEVMLEEIVTPPEKGFLGIFGRVNAVIRISVDETN